MWSQTIRELDELYLAMGIDLSQFIGLTSHVNLRYKPPATDQVAPHLPFADAISELRHIRSEVGRERDRVDHQIASAKRSLELKTFAVKQVGRYFKRFQHLTPLQQNERVQSYVSWRKRMDQNQDAAITNYDEIQSLWDSNKLPKKAIVWDTKASIIKDIVLAAPPLPQKQKAKQTAKQTKKENKDIVSNDNLARLHGRIILEIATWRSQNVYKKMLFSIIQRYSQCLPSFRMLTGTVATQQIQQAIDRIVQLSEKYPMLA
ncbi:hypothetical protein HK102_011932 [Quaeritorhiza haematococci]|nr:hypothetical protein HK102_011932 [Quaeritorhiza haematococci]